jgi:hypothetical protein
MELNGLFYDLIKIYLKVRDASVAEELFYRLLSLCGITLSCTILVNASPGYLRQLRQLIATVPQAVPYSVQAKSVSKPFKRFLHFSQFHCFLTTYSSVL